jgi:hypothetical protein
LCEGTLWAAARQWGPSPSGDRSETLPGAEEARVEEHTTERTEPGARESAGFALCRSTPCAIL